MAASSPGVPEVGTDGHRLDCGCAGPRRLGPWISASRIQRIETRGKDEYNTTRNRKARRKRR